MKPMLLCVVMLMIFRPVVSAEKEKDKGMETPIDKIPAVKDLNLDQLSGKWYLVSVASRCQYLSDYNQQVQSTVFVVSAPLSNTQPLVVNTLRKLNQDCWDIRQEYQKTETVGRFTIKGQEPHNEIDVVVGETDYTSYAVFYYQKNKKITVKLYGRSVKLPDSTLDRFEQIAEEQKLGIDFVYPFPHYGFCESAEDMHILKQ